AHWYGCYGNHEVRTPNVDALAARSAVFEEAFAEALPTLPARRALYTGRQIFPSYLVLQRDDQVRIRGWHGLYEEDVTLAETLRGAGYLTAWISDVYHQFKPGKNFHRGFECWRYVRGQESDRWASGPRRAIDLSRYLHPSQRTGAGTDVTGMALPSMAPGVLQYLTNRSWWKSEEDWLAARVFNEAAQWLDDNAAENQPFYLHVESFSPHEYWDPPDSFYRQYMKSDYRGPRLISPPPTTKDLSPVELEHVRALYHGFVTFVDDRIGRFLRKLEALGLDKNTVIVLTADHGTMLGQQGQIHKGEQRIRTQVTRVPLIIYHPQRGWAGKRIKGFALHTDVMPTVLDLLGVTAPRRVTGHSLVGMIERDERSPYGDRIVTGWGEHGAVRTPEWCYIGRWSRGPQFEELYDLRGDPEELNNVASQHPSVVKELREHLRKHVEAGWEVTRGTFGTVLLGPYAG
ncbi:MAG: sulfatase family protein, partial [Bryobacteraceae bacterium]